MKKFIPVFLALISFKNSFSQTDTLKELQKTDSSELLKEVIISAYGQNRKLINIPAPVSFVGRTQLERFNNTSLLPALNTLPGVRMEERSPGSYRLNIRGSSLRSPFGVRNVKVYWNEIPFTDPGGNTYLNQLGYYNISSMEIIKGPAGSLYGAGTGGAVLLHSQPGKWEQMAAVNYGIGSFGNRSLNAVVRFGSEDFQNTVTYSTQQVDGYREQSEMDRQVVSYEAKIKAAKNDELNAFFLYGDLDYETPGGLTKAQYDANPRAARPAAGAFPSAAQAQARIMQKTFLAGFTNKYQISSKFENVTSLYGAYSQVRNPSLRNYEKRNEPHFGGRTVFKYTEDLGSSDLKIVAGAEAQQGFSNVKVFGNRLGVQDSLQTDDEITNLQYFVFAQAELELHSGWIFTAGASLNRSDIDFSRVSTIPPADQSRTYNNEIAPRLSVLKNFGNFISVYASVAKGFSPPTLAELLPSTGVISTSLEAESGINYEAGVRGSFLQDKLFVEVNGFLFRMNNTLAQRRDAGGADYFENAGSTRQRGIETNLNYRIFNGSTAYFAGSGLFFSHTLNKFTYHDYKQLANDFSGNKLPSVAPHVISAGFDIVTKPGVYANATYYYSDPVPLNDANTDIANAFNLLGARVGFRHKLIGGLSMDIYGAVDNIFNRKYSLGNDINAAAGRYYNAAAGINYSAGVMLKVLL
ncbi:MAG: TonB-dependent receptor [Flavitalea sp.]